MVPAERLFQPFIDKIDELDIEKPRRAVINMVYRHISMHFIPYSNSLLLMALLLPQVSVYKVIGFNIIYVIIYATLGYFTYIRDIKDEKPQSREDSAIKNFYDALYTFADIFCRYFKCCV